MIDDATTDRQPPHPADSTDSALPGGTVRPARHSIPSLIFFLLLCAAGAAVGGMVDQGIWYSRLVKPELNPPSWLFGPVWTILYIMMAVAAWLVWRTETDRRARLIAIGLFIAQLVVNALWSLIFFGLHDITLALVDIVLLIILIVATIVAFYRVNPNAAWLLVPYLLWVCFATYLNGAIRTLN